MKKKENTNLQTENFAELSKRTCYNINDSSINFIFSLIIPVLASLVLVALFAFFATFSGSSYEAFVKTKTATVISLLYTPLVFFLIYFIYSKKCKINYRVASELKPKLNWQKVLTVITIGLISVFLISPFISLLDYGYKLIGYNPSNSLPYVMDNGFRYVLGIIVMAVVPAFCEELLFRGLIFKGLNSKFNGHVAVILSALMFTLLHGSLQQTVYQFILGLSLGYAMYYGKNIFYPMILHFVNNFVVVTMSFVYTITKVDVNAPTLYKTAWDYILPILLFVVAAGIIVGLVFLLKYFNKSEIEKSSKCLDNLEKTSDKSAKTEDDSNIINNSKKLKPARKSKNIEVVNANLLAPVENNEKTTLTNSSQSMPLTKLEMLWFYGGIALGVIIWLINTITAF